MVRLEFIKSLAALAAWWKVHPVLSNGDAIPQISKEQFGKDFIWGVATSAYQIEGNSDADGKGESVWDRFTQKRGKIRDSSDGKIAIDFYNSYKSDLALLKSLNFKHFRFSIAWSRILPDGTGKINQKGIDFYNKVINTCLELGIEPWVTLYHWDLPQTLEDKGGWTNRQIVNWFSAYADVCSKAFGDRVKHWIVLNEPAGFTALGYLAGIHAPDKPGLNNFFASVHHACLCQAEAGRIIRKNVADSHIGNALSCSYTVPLKSNKSHQRAARRMDVVLNRLFIEPSLGMGYPYQDLPLLRKIEKHIEPGDLEKLKFDFDFIGIQNYFKVVTKPSLIPYIWANRVKPNENAEVTDMGWEVDPDGIYQIIKQFARYPVKELIITENGAAFPDYPVNGRIHDAQRIDFFKRYLQQVLKAKNEGANVIGYFAWTFIDNFEWAEGYRPRFGLVYNDFQSQVRTIKDSGYWFRDFLK